MVDMLITSLLPDERGKHLSGTLWKSTLVIHRENVGKTSSTKVWGNPHVLSPFINRF